jgi:hypothetical protein
MPEPEEVEACSILMGKKEVISQLTKLPRVNVGKKMTNYEKRRFGTKFLTLLTAGLEPAASALPRFQLC